MNLIRAGFLFPIDHFIFLNENSIPYDFLNFFLLLFFNYFDPMIIYFLLHLVYYLCMLSDRPYVFFGFKGPLMRGGVVWGDIKPPTLGTFPPPNNM